jgi:hypothetical protein
MPLTMRPTGLSSGIDTTQSALANGKSAASTRPRRSQQSRTLLAPVTHHAILPLPRFLYRRCGVPSRGEFPGNGNQRSLAGTSNPI